MSERKGRAKSGPRVILAAGGMLWREGAARREIALVHRPRYGDWALPKGKPEPGESWPQTALREVREETGFDAELLEFAGVVSYDVGGTPKVVLFWHMRARGDPAFEPTEEVDEAAWLPLDQALEMLDYEGERELLRTFLEDR